MVGTLALLPFALVICSSLTTSIGSCSHLTLKNYVTAYTDPKIIRAIWNTVIVALGSTALATLLSAPLAWIVSRTNTPLKGIFTIFAIIPNLIPLLLIAKAWDFLANPQNGALNALLSSTFGLPHGFINIYSMGGLIFVIGVANAPLSFLMISSALNSVDSSFEEAATLSGAGRLRVLMGIDFSLIRHAILAAFLLNLVRAVENLEVPILLAVPARFNVLSTYIYEEALVKIPPNIPLAAALGGTMLVLTVTLVMIYRFTIRQSTKFATLGGRSFAARITDLGKGKYVTLAFAIIILVISMALPLGMLLLVSMEPYVHIPTWSTLTHLTFKNFPGVVFYPGVHVAIINSVMLATAAAFITMLLASMISLATLKTKIRGRSILETLTFLPFAVPGVTIGIAFLWLVLRTPFYYTLFGMGLAYVTRWLPFGVWSTNSNVLQINDDLEDAGRICGANFFQRFKDIFFPLFRPGFVAGWIFLFSIFIREFSSSVLLFNAPTNVLGPQLYALNTDGFPQLMSALGVIVIAICLVAVIAIRLFRGSRAIRMSEMV